MITGRDARKHDMVKIVTKTHNALRLKKKVLVGCKF